MLSLRKGAGGSFYDGRRFLSTLSSKGKAFQPSPLQTGKDQRGKGSRIPLPTTGGVGVYGLRMREAFSHIFRLVLRKGPVKPRLSSSERLPSQFKKIGSRIILFARGGRSTEKLFFPGEKKKKGGVFLPTWGEVKKEGGKRRLWITQSQDPLILKAGNFYP